MQKIKKPKVYMEGGVKGPSEYSGTCGYWAWGVLIVIVKAGGINIAEGIIKKSGGINPEYLLKTNPDVIIIAGPEPTRSMRPGYQANPEESRRLLKAFTQRMGWNTLSAVKSGRVYGVFNSYFNPNPSNYNFAALEAVAKWLYPDEFKDLDPEADLRKFYKKFLPIDYSDVWMIGIQD